ncbi:MAG: SpoIIE family protein phosphatase [Chloroflexota bacterium]
MISRLGRLTFACEQALGGGRQAVQQDRVRAEAVRTADGQRLVLAVVADGEGHRRSGEAAELVIQHVFQAVASSSARDLSLALQQGLEAGGRAVSQRVEKWEGKASVAATATAIWHGRAFVASAGHTRAYRLRDNHTTPIGPIDSRLLGTPGPVSIWCGERQGIPLQPGDQLVLATDGLTQVSPDDDRPYVDPSDVARHVEGNPPLEAARHLISMALGRDVLDNVSVIVIQVARRQGKVLRPVALAGALALLILLAAVVVVVLPRLGPSTPATQPQADLGYAVVVAGAAQIGSPDGEGQTIGGLGTMPGGVMVTAVQDLRLSLQTRAADAGDIATLTFYLGAGGTLELSVLDGGPGSAPTRLSLASGRLLMLRSGGTRDGRVRAAGAEVGFDGSGAGAVGLSTLPGRVIVECLVGRCALDLSGEELQLDAPAYVAVVEGVAGEPSVVPAEDIRYWNVLCGNCLPSP